MRDFSKSFKLWKYNHTLQMNWRLLWMCLRVSFECAWECVSVWLDYKCASIDNEHVCAYEHFLCPLLTCLKLRGLKWRRCRERPCDHNLSKRSSIKAKSRKIWRVSNKWREKEKWLEATLPVALRNKNPDTDPWSGYRKKKETGTSFKWDIRAFCGPMSEWVSRPRADV